MRSWQARRIIAETVRMTAQERSARVGSNWIQDYIADNAEAITVDVEAALIQARLLDPLDFIEHEPAADVVVIDRLDEIIERHG